MNNMKIFKSLRQKNFEGCFRSIKQEIAYQEKLKKQDELDINFNHCNLTGSLDLSSLTEFCGTLHIANNPELETIILPKYKI